MCQDFIGYTRNVSCIWNLLNSEQRISLAFCSSAENSMLRAKTFNLVGIKAAATDKLLHIKLSRTSIRCAYRTSCQRFYWHWLPRLHTELGMIMVACIEILKLYFTKKFVAQRTANSSIRESMPKRQNEWKKRKY